jgi:hypothetical protein
MNNNNIDNKKKQTDIDNYQNKVEIENRVAILLQNHPEESIAFKSIRQTVDNNSDNNNKIKYTQSRELHWSNLAIEFTNKYFPNLKINKAQDTYQKIKQHIMGEPSNQTTDINAIAALADMMKQFLAIQSDKTDRDLIPKPVKYDGTMDANTIDIYKLYI